LKSDFFFSKKKEILLLMELSAFFRGQRSKFCEWLFFYSLEFERLVFEELRTSIGELTMPNAV
jgi:hypothetical protein